MSASAPAIPNAVAPKGGDFVSFKAFPAKGSYILTVCAVKFIPNYENTKMDGTKEVFDALEFTVGASTEAGPRFIRMWPMKYSIHEKSNYSKFYKAVKGALPLAGSNPAELLGGGLQADVENEEKVSKTKKTPYTVSRIRGLSGVHPKLRGEVTPLGALEKALAEASKPKAEGAAASTKDDDEEGPF